MLSSEDDGSLSTARNSATPKPYSYKSSDHLRRAFEHLNEMRVSMSLCDVYLIAGSERFCAHRLVLAACSNYFRAMFTGSMTESRKQEVQMMNIDAQTLKILIDFFYTGEIIVADTNVQSPLPAACLLQLFEVENVCCEFLKKQLHSTNCLGIRAFADTHTCKDLLKAAEKYILANFQDVLNSEEFLLLTADQLSDIISKDELNVQSEDQVYISVMNWVNYDKPNRIPLLSKVLENIRFALFNPEFLVKTVSTDPLIKADLACRDLVDEAKNYLLLREDSQGSRTKARKPLKYGQLLYAVGGWCSGDALSSVERMDAHTGEWRTVAPMSKRRCGVGVAVLNNFVYAVGGHDGQKYLKCVERYDPRKNQWTCDVSPTSTCRTSVGVAVHDGTLYAVGGQDGVSCLNVVERYDPIRNEWKVVAPMNCRRLGVSVSVLDGQLYAVGGAEGQLPLNTVERYDPRIDKWYYVHPMNTQRKHLGTAVYNNHLYAIGGRAETCELNSGERYDPVRNEWTSIAPMNSRRSGVALAVVDNQMYAVGGFDGCSYLKSIEIYEDDNTTLNASDNYSTTTGHWRYAGSMSYRRLGGGVGVISLSSDDLDTFITGSTYKVEEHDADAGTANTSLCCLADFSYNLNFP